MTAKEYFNKYNRLIVEKILEDGSYFSAIVEMISDFGKECESLIVENNATTTMDINNIVNELNNKWNSVVLLFENTYGMSPIKKDGWLVIWLATSSDVYGNNYEGDNNND